MINMHIKVWDAQLKRRNFHEKEIKLYEDQLGGYGNNLLNHPLKQLFNKHLWIDPHPKHPADKWNTQATLA